MVFVLAFGSRRLAVSPCDTLLIVTVAFVNALFVTVTVWRHGDSCACPAAPGCRAPTGERAESALLVRPLVLLPLLLVLSTTQRGKGQLPQKQQPRQKQRVLA